MITTELILRVPEDILYTLKETKNDFIKKINIACVYRKTGDS